MTEKGRLLDLFEGKRYQKVILLVSVLSFLVLELLVYMAAASQAGQKSRVIVSDANGKKVYETSGAALTSYEKLVFENNFGPLRNYVVEVESETLPFPFRAWVSAAIGIPVGLVLLVAFLVRAYLSLLYGEDRASGEDGDPSHQKQNRFGSIMHTFQKVSVFQIGFLILTAVLLFWVVPNFLQDFASVSMAAIREYRWFFAASAGFLALIITWIIYLRYRLSKQMLDNQLTLEKFRFEKQLLLQQDTPVLLPESVNESQEQ